MQPSIIALVMRQAHKLSEDTLSMKKPSAINLSVTTYSMNQLFLPKDVNRLKNSASGSNQCLLWFPFPFSSSGVATMTFKPHSCTAKLELAQSFGVCMRAKVTMYCATYYVMYYWQLTIKYEWPTKDFCERPCTRTCALQK